MQGLLHDIGHGPFSHSYEDFVHRDLPQFLLKHPNVQSIYRDAAWPDLPQNWTHEMASLMMIDAALANLGLAIDLQHLDEPLKQIGNGIDARSMRATRYPALSSSPEVDDSLILSSRDWIFVKECIWGQPIPEIESVLGPGFHGRTQEYQDWLYDIVSNRHSGLDVDKVDYFARDRRRALRDSGEINKVMIEEAIVAWAECSDPATCHRCLKKKSPIKHLMICYPDKMIGPSMNFFKTRFELHSILYKHKTNVSVAFMISDILCLADPYFPVSIAPFSKKQAGGSNGAAKPEYDSLPLSRAMLHPLSYVRLRDSVIDQIVATTCVELEPARQLVYRLWSRDLYKCAVTKVLPIHKPNSNDRRIWNLPSAGIVKDIVGLGGVHGCDNGGFICLTENDVIVHKCDIHHGRKSQDPLSKMRFVEKSQLNKISCDYYKSLPEAKTVPEDEYDSILPKTLMECSLRIYCRDSGKVDLLRHAFEAWWDNANSEMDLTLGPVSPQRQNAKKKRLPVLSQDSDDDTMEEEPSHDEPNASLPPWCSPN
jgi:deoxynucleoside triphosphate triphosphohydrolase SAMHD1